VGKKSSKRTQPRAAYFPDGRFSVDEGAHCLSGGRASHLMIKQVEFIHKSWSVDQKASLRPATENRPAGKQAARGWVLLLLFLPTKKSRRKKGR
ncbi:MAG: hypothetical protein WAX48_11935, partial [Desulfosalsimonadaceae bacterium]